MSGEQNKNKQTLKPNKLFLLTTVRKRERINKLSDFLKFDCLI